MKTLLDAKVHRLQAQTGCPCCGESRKHFLKNPDHFPDWIVTDGYTFIDKAAIAFSCGSEFSIDEDDCIISRIPCANPSRDQASLMEADAESAFDEQEDAA